MNSNNILYIHHNSEDIGGADFCLFKMVREMEKVGFNSSVLLATPSPIYDLYRKHHFKVTLALAKPHNNSGFGFVLNIFRQLQEIFYIYRYIKRNRIRIVHSNDLLDLTSNIAAGLAGIKSCQHVRTQLNSAKPVTRLVCRLAYWNTDRLFCVSHAVQQHMFPYDSGKCRVLYDWHDFKAVEHDVQKIDLKTHLTLPQNIRLVGWIGRSVYWKGQHLFLDAIPAVIKRYANVHFILVTGKQFTDKPYNRRLHIGYEKETIKAHLSILGYRQDIASIMDQLDIVVNSSITPDPFPGVVLEALHSEKVVVAPRAGGVKEQIIDRETGFLFQAGESNDLAEKIILALQSLEQKNPMGQRAKRDVARRFSKEKLINDLTTTYYALM